MNDEVKVLNTEPYHMNYKWAEDVIIKKLSGSERRNTLLTYSMLTRIENDFRTSSLYNVNRLIQKYSGLTRNSINQALTFLDSIGAIETTYTKLKGKFSHKIISILANPSEVYRSTISAGEKPSTEIVQHSKEQLESKEPDILSYNPVAPATEVDEKQIGAVMKEFYDLGNKAIKFGNVHQREAAAKIIKQEGLPGAIELVRKAMANLSNPHAQKAITPLELWDKLAKIKAWEPPKKQAFKIVTI